MRQLIMGVAVALLLAGCSKATPDNFAKLEVGMKRDQVHQIIGKPSEIEGDADAGPLSLTIETWNNGSVQISITYSGDVVAMKTLTGDQAGP